MGDRDVLGAIVEIMDDRGYPPSISELADRFGVALMTIQRDLVKLEKAGKIARPDKRGRAIIILEQP